MTDPENFVVIVMGVIPVRGTAPLHPVCGIVCVFVCTTGGVFMQLCAFVYLGIYVYLYI
jgi:hypothetical protein